MKENIFKLHEANQAAAAALKSKLEDLRARQTQAEQDALQAAEAGSYADYKAQKAESAQIADEIFFTEVQIRKLSAPLSYEKAKAAFDEHAAAAEKTMQKKWTEYREARQRLYSLFTALMDDYNDLYRFREDCARICDKKDRNGAPDIAAFPIKKELTLADIGADRNFFKAFAGLDIDTYTRYGLLALGHRSTP